MSRWRNWLSWLRPGAGPGVSGGAGAAGTGSTQSGVYLTTKPTQTPKKRLNEPTNPQTRQARKQPVPFPVPGIFIMDYDCSEIIKL